jgi:hypothetical protein
MKTPWLQKIGEYRIDEIENNKLRNLLQDNFRIPCEDMNDNMQFKFDGLKK